MTRRSRRRRRLGARTALVGLATSAAFVAWSLATTFGGDGGAAGGLARLVGFEDPPELDAANGDGEAGWCDLLAVHGSYAGGPVRFAFASLVDVPPAAPAGETAILRAGWTGADPPLLRLGVVMVSAGSRRAVLAGAVVGVGGEVAGCTVVGIEPGLVRLRWRDRWLTYDLDSEAPREFRAEYERRSRAREGASDGSRGNEEEGR